MALEILSPEWKYENSVGGNFENILQVKEQRRLGTSRGNTTTPQAPVIHVRFQNDDVDKKLFVRADLWCYGPAYRGKNSMNTLEPEDVTKGSPFTKLRGNTYITCTENIEELTVGSDGCSYAKLKCFVTRGARVFCRKNHVALRVCVVSQEEGGIFREIAEISPIRTARLSISEKAMCPRESDRKRKAKTSKATSSRPFDQTYLLKRQKLNENGELFLKQLAATNLINYNPLGDLSLGLPPATLPQLIGTQTAQRFNPTKQPLQQSNFGNTLAPLVDDTCKTPPFKSLIMNPHAAELYSFLQSDNGFQIQPSTALNLSALAPPSSLFL